MAIEGRLLSRLEYAKLELGAALDFWRDYRNAGSRHRVRDAISEYRNASAEIDGYESWAAQLGKDRARGLEI